MKLISGHGSSKPSVMLIADSARGEDLKTNYALSGFTENRLKDFTRRAHLNYSDFYKTCLVKGELPKVSIETKRKKIPEAEVARSYLSTVVPSFASLLINEIKTLKPNLVIPLGELGFQFLTGLEGIRKFRGSILAASSIHQFDHLVKVLPILGPDPYLNQDYKLKYITQIDFNKIPKWVGNQPIPDDTYRIWVCRNSTALRNYIDRHYPVCKKKTIEQGGFLVFDIETYMNIPTCISFCFDGFESCCIPILDSSIDFDNRALMLSQIAELLNSEIPKVNQNIKYDWKTLERFGFLVRNVVGDTLLSASTLYCEFPKNLGFLTSIYTDLPYFKDEGRQYDPSKHKKEQFYLYNAKDSLATHQIYSKQVPEIKEQGTQFVYDRLVQLIPIYKRMEDRGLRRDEATRDKLHAKYQSLFSTHKFMLRKLANNDSLNPLSSVQMNKLVFDELGYTKIRGVKGSDEDSLNMLMAFGRCPKVKEENAKQILQEIILCRKIHKVLEILDLDVYPDGRFRCEFNLAGTETGRTSASKTTDYFLKLHQGPKALELKTTNLGHSLQTIGKHGFRINGEEYGTDVRAMFVASVGHSFVEIDLSGAEARVDRVLSGNFDMGVFDNPGIHKLTGSWLFNCTPADLKKNTLEYQLAKMARHAAERNVQANTFFP